jgi:hypothetical protein
MLGVAQRLSSSPSIDLEIQRRFQDQFDFDLRCAAPGIIQSFDAVAQTVSVQLVIKDLIQIAGKTGGGVLQSLTIPILQDVPIVIPRAGGFAITLPIQVGDECLVIFADSCIDSWWQNGDVQEPMSLRRHDLSDGFAILGTWSQPNTITNYNPNALEIRTEDGATTLRIEDGAVTILSNSIKLGDTAGLRKLIDERLINLFNTHIHTDSTTSGITGTPTVPISDLLCATINTEAL